MDFIPDCEAQWNQHFYLFITVDKEKFFILSFLIASILLTYQYLMLMEIINGLLSKQKNLMEILFVFVVLVYIMKFIQISFDINLTYLSV